MHLSCSPPPPQSKIPQDCNNSGVGGVWGELVAGCRAQGGSEAEGWQLGPGPQAEESPQGSITLEEGELNYSMGK